MSNSDFTVYKGKFICKECGIEVYSLRLWHEDGHVTWMCKNKHVSSVNLIRKKQSKKDFNNE